MKSEEREIDGLRVTVIKFNVLEGTKLKADLGALVGPAIAQVAPLLEKGAAFGEMDVDALAPSVVTLFRNMKSSDIEPLLIKILRRTTVIKPDERGQMIKIDLTSAADIDRTFDSEVTMWKVVWFALGVNFRDFLDVRAQRAASETPMPVH